MEKTHNTERLIIRRFKESDYADLYEYLSDKRTVEFEPYDIFTEDDCKREAVRRSESKDFWAVCLKETNKLIGNIYLSEKDFETWELGYVFNPSFWGKGYATEASRKLVSYIFSEHGAHRVYAGCDPLNTASWKLLERLGMRREGHLLSNVYFKNDENGQPIWKDTYEYAVLACEWNNK